MPPLKYYIIIGFSSVVVQEYSERTGPDSKVHGANMGPTRVLSSPDGPHVGPMNLAIRELNNVSADTMVPCINRL